MKSSRTLRLHRESLTELDRDDLRGVAAGVETRADSCHVTWWDCPSFDRCPTLPLNECPIYIVLPATTGVTA